MKTACLWQRTGRQRAVRPVLASFLIVFGLLQPKTCTPVETVVIPSSDESSPAVTLGVAGLDAGGFWVTATDKESDYEAQISQKLALTAYSEDEDGGTKSVEIWLAISRQCEDLATGMPVFATKAPSVVASREIDAVPGDTVSPQISTNFQFQLADFLPDLYAGDCHPTQKLIKVEVIAWATGENFHGGAGMTAPVDLTAYWESGAESDMTIQTVQEMIHITNTARHIPITTWERLSPIQQAEYEPGVRGVKAQFEREWDTFQSPGITSYDKGFLWKAQDTSGSPTVSHNEAMVWFSEEADGTPYNWGHASLLEFTNYDNFDWALPGYRLRISNEGPPEIVNWVCDIAAVEDEDFGSPNTSLHNQVRPIGPYRDDAKEVTIWQNVNWVSEEPEHLRCGEEGE